MDRRSAGMKEKTFLWELAERLHAEYGKGIEDLHVLFPNRRTGLFFKEALSKQLQAPIWAPRVDSLHDFLYAALDYQRPDALEQLLLLYEVYQQVCTGRRESLDRFFIWGEILLRDMEHITNYECPVEELFAHVENIKEIDGHFLFEDAEKIAVAKRFWTHFLGAQRAQKEDFLRWWRLLPELYKRFHEALREKGLAYDGFLTHLAAQHCRTKTFPVPKHRLVFAGFPALSTSEGVFLRHFVQQHEALVFWDLDAYYVEHDWHRAGTFFRQYRKDKILGKTFPVELPRNFEKEKRIEVRVAPSAVAQVKSTAAFLAQQQDWETERIAIVLPEERMLIPMLHALPTACLAQVNVTMGYPMLATPLASLMEHLLVLWEARSHPSLAALLPILEHTYVHPLSSEAVSERLRAYKSHAQGLDPKTLLAESDFLHELLVLSRREKTNLLSWLTDVLRHLQEGLVAAKRLYHFDEQLLKALIDRFEALQKSPLQGYWEELSSLGRKRLMKRILSAMRLPFSGEPLKNIQIMGVYDTRNLDMDKVIILDMNEGLWPMSTRPASFLPYSLRKAYGLPVIADAYTVSSYLFYRLLQRCPHVRIYYVHDEQAREKSSFLHQLSYESMRPLDEALLDTSLHLASRKEIRIPKTEAQLSGWAGQTSPLRLSVGALAAYLDCPLQFYFKYLRRLHIPSAEFEAFALGSIFHDTMQALYTPYVGNGELTKAVLEDCEKQVPTLLDQACTAYYKSDSSTGERHLIKQVLQRMLRSMLSEDKAYAPFRVLALEQDYARNFSVQVGGSVGGSAVDVEVYGRLDRVDYKDGAGYRVLDYKTGYMQPKSFDLDLLFDKEEAYAHRIQRQVLLYAYLYGAHKQVDVQACIALGRTLLSGHASGLLPIGTATRAQKSDIGVQSDKLFRAQQSDIEAQLKQLLRTRMFHTEEPFSQTTAVQKVCVYCPYRRLCHGEAGPSAAREAQK